MPIVVRVQVQGRGKRVQDLVSEREREKWREGEGERKGRSVNSLARVTGRERESEREEESEKESLCEWKRGTKPDQASDCQSPYGEVRYNSKGSLG